MNDNWLNTESEQEVDEKWLLSEKSVERLHPHERMIYREHRRELLTWLLNYGKNPEIEEGYAETTVKTRAKRLDLFYRWVWDVEEGYTEDITFAHANAWVQHLALRSISDSYCLCCVKALKMLFKWQRYTKGLDEEWTSPVNFSESSRLSAPDILTRDERKRLRESSLTYGKTPEFDCLTETERDWWKAYLAQRYGKPKTDVTSDDFERTQSWKYPSLFWATLDGGLRPIEIERAEVSWVDLDQGVLRIPGEEAAKNTDDWSVSLLERTVLILERWLKEREQKQRYQGTDALWLTSHGNRYQSQTLNPIFREVCDLAGINREGRDLTWYSIRHSVGTYMAYEEGIEAAANQLRHRSLESTLRYTQVPIEERRDALNRMG